MEDGKRTEKEKINKGSQKGKARQDKEGVRTVLRDNGFHPGKVPDMSDGHPFFLYWLTIAHMGLRLLQKNTKEEKNRIPLMKQQAPQTHTNENSLSGLQVIHFLITPLLRDKNKKKRISPS